LDEASRGNPEQQAKRLSRIVSRLRLALWPAVIGVFGILLFVAFRALHHEISYADILVAIRETPASDASRVIAHYSQQWQKPHVMLLGYSQGANVSPFLVNRLSSDARGKVSLVAMTGLGLEADFEFHFANWAGASALALAILPETARLGSPKAICIYGKEDPESSCTQLDQRRVQSIALPGGHHFNGDYGKVAATILQAATAARR
jgi:type IV secretory pathway VirJ component